MSESDDWDRLLQGFRDGDSALAQDFWNRYGEPLRRIAEKHLGEGLKQRVGAEDVVQSVCRTFFRRIQGGQLHVTDGEGLWRLLCAITLNKIRQQTRFHLRQKRALNQEQSLSPTDESGAGFDPIDDALSPTNAVQWSEQLERLMNGLDEEERSIVDLKLQEFTHEEVADRLGISERTVRRLFKRVQSKLLRMLDEPE